MASPVNSCPPPEKDWTDVHAGGINRIRYIWGRYLPMSLAWETLESQRWGPAITDSTPYDEPRAAEWPESRLSKMWSNSDPSARGPILA